MTTDALSSGSPATVSVTAAAADRADLLEQAVVLPEVDWDQYVGLRDNPANRGLRMTYREGVPEVLRWRDEALTVYQLVHGDYVERPESGAWPDFRSISFVRLWRDAVPSMKPRSCVSAIAGAAQTRPLA